MPLPIIVGKLLTSRTVWAVGGTILGSLVTSKFGVDIVKELKEGCEGIVEDIKKDFAERAKHADRNKKLVDDIRSGKG